MVKLSEAKQSFLQLLTLQKHHQVFEETEKQKNPEHIDFASTMLRMKEG